MCSLINVCDAHRSPDIETPVHPLIHSDRGNTPFRITAAFELKEMLGSKIITRLRPKNRLTINIRRCLLEETSKEELETEKEPVRADPYAELPESSCFFVPNISPGARLKEFEDMRFFSEGRDKLGLENVQMTMKEYFAGDLHQSHKIFVGQNQNYKQGQKVEQRTFLDLRLVRLKSGNGGNGSVSFFRDAHRPVGPPDGGDGGNGGNIYVQVVKNMGLLHGIQRSYQAKGGGSGTSRQLDGKRGEDVILEVPVGTTMRWIPDPLMVKKQLKEVAEGDIGNVNMALKFTPDYDVQLFRNDYKPGEGWVFKEKDEDYHQERSYFTELNEQVKDYDREIIAEELNFDRFPLAGIDFDKPTEKPVLILKGGKGGMGNMHFLTGDVRNPRFSKRGRKGLCEYFMLELKLLADLGLVGLPNAGKLSLLRAISKARPRVGHWEFTTLQPTIGTIFTRIDEDPFTVADIPGIIRGASENKGMGMDFLRHIERSGGLVFVVSLESENPQEDLQILIEEVGEQRMKDKRVMVVATKADLTNNGESYTKLVDFIKQNNENWHYIPVCAPKGENIETAIKMMSLLARA